MPQFPRPPPTFFFSINTTSTFSYSQGDSQQHKTPHHRKHLFPPLHQNFFTANTNTHPYQLLQLHQNNGGLHQALNPHLPTRRPSRFTEDIFGHDLTRITSHDYDCALGIEGGNCEVLPAFPASPPNSYPPLPSSILISGSSHSSETNQKNSTSRSRASTQRPRTPGT